MGKSAGDTPWFELPMRTWTPRQSHSFNRQLCTLLIRILDLSKLCSKKELGWFVNFTPEGACGRSNLFKTVVLGKCKNKGGCNKKWTGRSNTRFSVNIGPTETYYIPNQWKLNKVLAELCRIEIAALIESDNQG